MSNEAGITLYIIILFFFGLLLISRVLNKEKRQEKLDKTDEDKALQSPDEIIDMNKNEQLPNKNADINKNKHLLRQIGSAILLSFLQNPQNWNHESHRTKGPKSAPFFLDKLWKGAACTRSSASGTVYGSI
jgi:hypothetical protein